MHLWHPRVAQLSASFRERNTTLLAGPRPQFEICSARWTSYRLSEFSRSALLFAVAFTTSGKSPGVQAPGREPDLGKTTGYTCRLPTRLISRLLTRVSFIRTVNGRSEIIVQAYSPLIQHRRGTFDNPVIAAMRTNTENIMLKYSSTGLCRRGTVSRIFGPRRAGLPTTVISQVGKTSDPKRIVSNPVVYDFEFHEKDMVDLDPVDVPSTSLGNLSGNGLRGGRS